MNDRPLHLTGIKKSFRRGAVNEVCVLRGVEIALAAGESVGLVAPSGAGKSTLLHIAGLLETPDEGTVSIYGEAMNGATDRHRTRTRRRDIGFVYQMHHLLPEFTAIENVMLPMLADGSGREEAYPRACELLMGVGLEARASHRPAELSGGEQQRVAICRALANGPRILLADEPTGNLDEETSFRVFAALVNVIRKGRLSALIATHDLGLARRMDRTLRLVDGCVSEC